MIQAKAEDRDAQLHWRVKADTQRREEAAATAARAEETAAAAQANALAREESITASNQALSEAMEGDCEWRDLRVLELRAMLRTAADERICESRRREEEAALALVEVEERAWERTEQAEEQKLIDQEWAQDRIDAAEAIEEACRLHALEQESEMWREAEQHISDIEAEEELEFVEAREEETADELAEADANEAAEMELAEFNTANEERAAMEEHCVAEARRGRQAADERAEAAEAEAEAITATAEEAASEAQQRCEEEVVAILRRVAEDVASMYATKDEVSEAAAAAAARAEEGARTASAAGRARQRAAHEKAEAARHLEAVIMDRFRAEEREANTRMERAVDALKVHLEADRERMQREAARSAELLEEAERRAAETEASLELESRRRVAAAERRTAEVFCEAIQAVTEMNARKEVGMKAYEQGLARSEETAAQLLADRSRAERRAAAEELAAAEACAQLQQAAREMSEAHQERVAGLEAVTAEEVKQLRASAAEAEACMAAGWHNASQVCEAEGLAGEALAEVVEERSAAVRGREAAELESARLALAEAEERIAVAERAAAERVGDLRAEAAREAFDAGQQLMHVNSEAADHVGSILQEADIAAMRAEADEEQTVAAAEARASSQAFALAAERMAEQWINECQETLADTASALRQHESRAADLELSTAEALESIREQQEALEATAERRAAIASAAAEAQERRAEQAKRSSELIKEEAALALQELEEEAREEVRLAKHRVAVALDALEKNRPAASGPAPSDRSTWSLLEDPPHRQPLESSAAPSESEDDLGAQECEGTEAASGDSPHSPRP